jgi:hypothetical protein
VFKNLEIDLKKNHMDLQNAISVGIAVDEKLEEVTNEMLYLQK